MSIESEITVHYAKKDASEVESGNAHLHIGGEKATRYFFDTLGLKPGMKVLDIGCGVGGPSILAAEEYGCDVTGIDLTPEFVEIAQERASRSPAAKRLEFQTANATALSFGNENFDLVMMLHVGMNIPNKQDVYKECARVLKPGGRIALYDILAQENVAQMIYPCPWAPTIETSFMEDFRTIGSKLKAAEFAITEHEERRKFAITAITAMIEKIGGALSPFRKTAVENLLKNVGNNACAPHIIIARKSG